MNNVHFLSDPHFGHRLVSKLRGFDNPNDHDHTLVYNYCRVVSANDIVWFLGDLSVRNLHYALGIIYHLPGRKRLILGNHDEGHPMHRESWKHARDYHEVFEWVAPFARIKIDQQDVLLSHFPYTKDRHEARYMQYRLRDEGKWLLHGHTHQADQRKEGREIHVGLDAWDLTPVSLTTIRDLMQEQ